MELYTFEKLTSGKNCLFMDGDWIEKKDQDPNGEVRLIQLADLGAGEFKNVSNKRVTIERAKELNCTFLKKGDILIARLPDPLGRACIFPLDGLFITAVDVTVLRVDPEQVDRKYLMYFINSPQFRKAIKKYESGTTRKRISRKNLGKIQFSIPSLDIQQQIVTHIEELFSDLDDGVATLEKTKKELELYRQAVLDKVFSSLSGEKKLLIDVLKDKPRNGYSPKPVDYETPYRNLTLTATTSGIFKEGYFKYIDVDIDADSYLWVKHDDILIQRGNTAEYVGISALYKGEDNKYTYPDLMMKCHTVEGVIPAFILYQMQAPKARAYMRKHATGTAGSMPKINQKTVMNVPIIMVDKDMQKQVVTAIESRLSVCDEISASIDTALQQAASLRQSILKKAFEGELVHE